MTPRAIYDSPLSNGGDKRGEMGRGADALWLRAIADMEREDGEAVARVYPGTSKPPVASVSSTPGLVAIDRREAGAANHSDRPAATSTR